MLPLALQFCSGPARPQAPAPCQEQVSPEQWCCQLGPVSNSSFRQVPTRDGEALADILSVSGKGQRRRGRGGRRERREGRRVVEEGGGGRGRTESHSFKLFG